MTHDSFNSTAHNTKQADNRATSPQRQTGRPRSAVAHDALYISKKEMKTKTLFSIFSIGFLISCSPKATQRVGSTEPAANRNIAWESYDNSSTVKKTEITPQQLQGEWAAYKGVYKFGAHLNEMKLDKPFIVEVKNQTFRRNKDSEFEQFELFENLIIKKTSSKADTGIINKLTATELTISWKNGSNYTRYLYEKKH